MYCRPISVNTTKKNNLSTKKPRSSFACHANSQTNTKLRCTPPRAFHYFKYRGRIVAIVYCWPSSPKYVQLTEQPSLPTEVQCSAQRMAPDAHCAKNTQSKHHSCFSVGALWQKRSYPYSVEMLSFIFNVHRGKANVVHRELEC